MPRVAITVRQLTRDAGTDPGAYTNLDAANGHTVPAGRDGKMFLHVKNTAASPKNVTIKAGSHFRSGVGDLVVQVPATTGERFIGPLESSRFEQADENIYVDLEAGMTGSALAIRLP